MSKNPSGNGADSDLPMGAQKGQSQRTPLWQAVLLPIAAIFVFFLVLEGGLALLGVRSTLKTEDPFVGFASNVPLFVPSPAPGQGQLMVTAQNKLNYFNMQSFPREKPKNTYRIFSVGGSTTYGRPYNDTTSYSGWLRELLPAADRSKNWEVVNAGGISYASYRVAHLMEELVKYQPDLFIIYTGHNEFLEERTYNKLRDMPPLLRSTVSLLARTRTWSAMTGALQRLGIHPQTKKEKRDQLAGEVDTILDRSAGPERYTRDDSLRENILEHYRISLERMMALADSVNAKVIFVTPASNLKDCTPFKSEHTQGLAPAVREEAEQMLAEAKALIEQAKWAEALDLLDKAALLDPRDAEVQYRRGQVLLALRNFREAESALRLARDEDVCPLRALTPMRDIVTEIASEQNAGLVDYVGLLEQQMESEMGEPIPGEEYFLDHVHPTIKGHKILAVALIREMITEGIVHPGVDWDEKAIATVSERIEGRIDKDVHGQALASLARVLLWAGKNEDAARAARQALEIAGENKGVAADANSILVTVYQRMEKPELVLELLRSAIEKNPEAIELRLKLGQTLFNRRFLQLEEAAANLLLVCQQMPYYDVAYQYFGQTMLKRGRLDIAYVSLLEALRLNPKNNSARNALAQIQAITGKQVPVPQLPNILLDVYPSRAPKMLTQVRKDPTGRFIPEGIQVEFYENGRIKLFIDVSGGVPNGLETKWDMDGNVVSRVVYRQGKPVE